ncbi:MAG: stage II sporulation protein R [Christensenellales bacterium]|jgi:stage II sporulation protein R
MKYLLKKTGVALMVAVLFIGMIGCYADRDGEGEVFRLHILANSDSEADQKIKLCVRDKILDYMKNFEVESEEQAKIVAQNNLEEIQAVANRALAEADAPYQAKAQVGVFDFPAKQYGEEFYPAGKYDALRIGLGEAVGRNWWCVMFPPLCVMDLSYAENQDYEERLEAMVDGDVQVEYDSFFAKLWRDIFGE